VIHSRSVGNRNGYLLVTDLSIACIFGYQAAKSTALSRSTVVGCVNILVGVDAYRLVSY
jgi:hypothetical protein